MAEPVRVRRLTDQEGRRVQQIVRRGSTNSVRYRHAMMLLASAGGNRVPVIARLVAADEDTVRDVIHRFNEIGLACLDPRWAGSRPRLLSDDDEDFVVQTATTRPTKLGQPFTRWSLRADTSPARLSTLAQRQRPPPRRPGRRTQGTRPHPKREGHPLGRTPPQHRSLTNRELTQPQRIIGPLVAKRGRPERCEDDLGWADPEPRTGPVQEKGGARGE